ncbi:glycerol-3-phosphate acyltransferase [bacterium BMS3Abin04]|nr:glycerol-3-phosphate acyltransferase [bacterium BMS3Abin04]
MERYLISAITGYLLGSIPTAYLVLKKKGMDITKEGSRNVGTLNSYEVSNSKLIGIFVFVIDLLKGILSVLIVKLLFGELFIFPMIAVIFAVSAHCYNPWIKFKGGKGLAAAAGGSIFLFPQILVLWIIFWIALYLYKKNIQVANSFASLLTGLLVLATSDILNGFSTPPAKSVIFFETSIIFLFLIIISKHIFPLKEYFEEQSKKIRNREK